MKIALPDTAGRLADYTLVGTPIAPKPLGADPARVVFSAAHVVADPFTDAEPSGPAALDWDATMAFRRHLAGLGLGIAEAMDTAQRGMGLDWPGALELIRRTKAEVAPELPPVISPLCESDLVVQANLQVGPGDTRQLIPIR